MDDDTTIEELREQITSLETQVEELQAEDDSPTEMVIIATKGTLDMAYPVLILGPMAAAFGWNVTVFATFWGLDMLHEENYRDLKLSSAGNPNMPLPNLLAVMPGMDRLTTKMMRDKIDEVGTDSVPELVERGLENGVNFQACQMTMDLMDYDDGEFIDGVETGVGAAHALRQMADSDVQLLV
ncbi:NADH dehydrogenase [Halodesulfurarchaeum formicicum]|uniref:NADH dehydrogenase n=1 Tax=Halodesulfurarchaeum formicicum TaxID=1873524 RepID=A0A1D8S1M1_9EURY|nr:DsrE/DsrF/DrsH-like family protein [Halodesulfurarchaeum formicicum]AOW79233.1 NADH dehydrogenase [Halodesulfurarchaeum formicicum]APE94499.1 NADH dehydrogenase [Halodesulfurarchaeum formicicum]